MNRTIRKASEERIKEVTRLSAADAALGRCVPAPAEQRAARRLRRPPLVPPQRHHHRHADPSRLRPRVAPSGAGRRRVSAGTVVFAENLGIYGDAVIIDHGLGIFSLYGHLSAITVRRRARRSQRGDVGRTHRRDRPRRRRSPALQHHALRRPRRSGGVVGRQVDPRSRDRQARAVSARDRHGSHTMGDDARGRPRGAPRRRHRATTTPRRDADAARRPLDRARSRDRRALGRVADDAHAIALRDLATAAERRGWKAVGKDARRALYRLSQRGVVVPAAPAEPAPAPRWTTQRRSRAGCQQYEPNQ